MKKIALLCDSAADISKEAAKALDIHVIRMPLMVEDKTYIEEVDISQEDIIRMLKEGKTIKTTQPPIGEVTALWEQLLTQYDEIFYLPLSRELSGTCENAIAASKEYDGKVTVVNSTFACYPIILMLEQARKLFQQGYSCKQVKEMFEKQGELYAILIPENLTTLKNGGRISPAAAALAGLLKIHPLLTIEEGRIDVYDKVRTLNKAYKEGLAAVMKGIENAEDYDWMIIDADNRSASDALKGMMEEALGVPVQQTTFRSIIMSHTGVGTIAFGRIRKVVPQEAPQEAV